MTTISGLELGASRSRAVEWHESFPFAGLALVVVAVLAMLVYILSGARPLPHPERPPHTVCGSEACVLYARLLNASAGAAHDPCDDFYLHVCYGAMMAAQENAVLPPPAASNTPDRVSILLPLLEQSLMENVPRKGGSQSAVQKAAAYYASCHEFADAVNSSGLEQLRSLLDRSGLTWPHRREVSGDVGTLLAQLLLASERVGLPALVSAQPISPETLRLIPARRLGEHRLRLKFMGRWRFRDYYSLLANMLARPSDGTQPESFKEFEVVYNAADKKLEPVLGTAAPEIIQEELISWDNAANTTALPLTEPWRKAVTEYLRNSTGNAPSVHLTTSLTWVVVQNRSYLDALTSLVDELGTQSAHLYAGWMLVQHVAPLLSRRLAGLLFSGWEVSDVLVHRLCLKHLDLTLGYATVGHAVQELASPSPDVQQLAADVVDLTEKLEVWKKTPVGVSERLVGLSDLLPTGDALDDAYSSFADMRTDAFLDNWLRALDGRRSTSWPGRAAIGFSYLARLADAPFFDMTREWLPQRSSSTAGAARSAQIRQLLVVRPHHVAFPMFGDNVTAAIRFGTLGAQLAWALAASVDGGSEAADECPRWLRRMRLVRDLQFAALEERASEAEERLRGLERLSESAQLFVVSCLLLCDRDPSEQLVALCNEPLAGDARFARAFGCAADSAMATSRHKCGDAR